jgi:tetratricopeptide (TPR) repeat protein
MGHAAWSALWLAAALAMPLNAGASTVQDEAREQWLLSVRGAFELFRDGKTPEAEARLRRALQDAPTVDIEPAAVAGVWGVLGRVYEDLGRIQESEHAYRKGLAGYERALPAEDGHIIRALANLVLFYLRTDQVGKIERLEARCRWLAATEPRTVQHAWLMNALGMLFCYRGHFEEAETALVEALSIEEHARGDAALRNDIRANLGAVYIETSRPAKAREVYLEVVRDEERRIGAANPQLIPALASLAASCHFAGYDDEARLVLERGIAIADATIASKHPKRVRLLSLYAHVLRALHRDKEAKTAEKQALAIKRELEKDNPSGLIVDVSELSKKPSPAQ